MSNRKTENAKAFTEDARLQAERGQTLYSNYGRGVGNTSSGKAVDTSLLSHLDPSSIDAILKFLK